MPWWGVLLVAVGAAVLGAIAVTYYIGRGMFRRF